MVSKSEDAAVRDKRVLDNGLVSAARTGKASRVAELLRLGADTEARCKWGMTALHWAARNKRWGCVEELLGKADAKAESQGGDSALLCALDGLVAVSLTEDDKEVLLKLVERSNAGFVGAEGRTALMKAAEAGAAFLVKRLIPSSDAEAVDSEGSSALHWAALSGDEECVRLLLPKSRCKAADIYGRTALMHAAMAESEGCVEALLAESDAGARDFDGVDALGFSEKRGVRRLLRKALDGEPKKKAGRKVKRG